MSKSISLSLKIDFFLIADIIELFEAFKEHDVQKNLTIVHLILTAWSISLMQFTLVVTSTKSRKKRTDNPDTAEKLDKCFSCRLFWETELWVNGLIHLSCHLNLRLNLGTFNNNSFTRRSISLSSSRFNNPLSNHFSIECIFYH